MKSFKGFVEAKEDSFSEVLKSEKRLRDSIDKQEKYVKSIKDSFKKHGKNNSIPSLLKDLEKEISSFKNEYKN